MATNKKKNQQPKETRLERNHKIFDLYLKGMTSYEIAKSLDMSGSTVRNVLRSLERIHVKNAKDAKTYFTIGSQISTILRENGFDPDAYAARVTNALWVYGYTTPTKLKKLSDDEFNEFLCTKRLRMAGFATWEAVRQFREYSILHPVTKKRCAE